MESAEFSEDKQYTDEEESGLDQRTQTGDTSCKKIAMPIVNVEFIVSNVTKEGVFTIR